MELLSKATLPIGWDYPEKRAEMKEVSVAVFNKVIVYFLMSISALSLFYYGRLI